MSSKVEQKDMGADSINTIDVETGGFVVRNANQFDKAIAQIADDAGNYYVLGYLPPSPADGKFHRIGVKVKRQGVSVRARRGYTATPRPRPAMTATAPTGETNASSVRLPPSRAERASASLAVASGGGGKPDTTDGSAAVAVVSAPSTASSSTVRLRPDASKHI